MKRTTILSFAGAIITVVAIIGFVAYYSNAHEKRLIKEINNTADYLADQGFMEMPTNKYLYIDYIVPESHKTNPAYQAADIKIVGVRSNARLQASKKLLPYIYTEQQGDTTIVKVDMRDKKWWIKRSSLRRRNQMIGSLLTIYVPEDVQSISSTKQILRTPLAMNLYLVKSNNLDVNLYGCTLYAEDAQVGHLNISNPHTAVLMENVHSKFTSIKDRPDSLYNRTVQCKANPNMKRKMRVFTNVRRRNCSIDTLQTIFHNRMQVGSLDDIKVFRWKALNDSANVKFTPSEGTKIESI